MTGYCFFRNPNSSALYGFQGEVNQLNNLGPLEDGFYVTDLEKKRCFKISLDKEVKWDDLPIDEKQEMPNELNPVVNVSEDDYHEIVSRAIDFSEEYNGKVVVSRIKSVGLSENFNISSFYQELCSRYPNAFVYFFHIPTIGSWVGATPEVLIKGENNAFKMFSLAGSRNVENPFEWSEKEKTEQQLVTDAIVESLNSLAVKHKVGEVETYRAGNVEHLLTTIDLQTDKLDALIDKIHPTPAVAGYPRMKALQFIRSNELHDREFYTGIIGWKKKNSVNLFVNLRCAKLTAKSIHCFVGGGITAQSDSQKEWVETNFKADTLLSVLEKK